MSMKDMKMPELRTLAKERNIKVEFGMKKVDILAALEADEAGEAPAPSVTIKTAKSDDGSMMVGDKPLKKGMARVIIQNTEKNKKPQFLGGEKSVYVPRGQEFDITKSHYGMLNDAKATETEFGKDGKATGATLDVHAHPFQTIATNF